MKKIIGILVLFALIVLSCCQVQAQKVATFEQVGNKEVKGSIVTYTTSNGVEFNVGDTIKIGYPFRNNRFSNIYSTSQMTIAAIGGTTILTLDASQTGGFGIIKKMKASQRKCYVTTYANGESVGLTIPNFDEAFITGEVIINGYMSSDEALTQLKREKDKLDLELITHSEYDKRKSELIKHIK